MNFMKQILLGIVIGLVLAFLLHVLVCPSSTVNPKKGVTINVR